MRKAIYSLFVVYTLIIFCQCDKNYPKDFEEIPWGINIEQLKENLDQKNIAYEIKSEDAGEYIQTYGTFFGIENTQIRFYFKKNKFYMGYVGIHRNIEYFDEIGKEIEALIIYNDNKYKEHHYVGSKDEVSYFWVFKNYYIEITSKLFLDNWINVRIIYRKGN